MLYDHILYLVKRENSLAYILVVLLLELSQVWDFWKVLFLFFLIFNFFFIESSTSAHSIQISLGI